MKKMLLALAHQGDETTALGGTIAKYAKAKWGISRVFATVMGFGEGTISALTPGTLEDPIYRAMEQELPNVVITFDKTGINHDPDHVRMCYATTYAFQKYASRLEALHRKYDEPKLYYACAPASTVTRAVRKGELPRESFGKLWRGTPDDQITTVIDTLSGREYFILKMEGTKEHFVSKNDSIRDCL